ncbi:MAG: hypothetical protein IJI46_04190 [Erysipelotrichaceae bacterium]|nr:hypothetical protein [Erysipelotrichaceae bacterium]
MSKTKGMKSIIKLATIICVCLSLVSVQGSPAFAEEYNTSDIIEYESLRESDYSGYYVDENGNYYSLNEIGEVVPVEYLEIDYSNEELISRLMDSDELLDDFKEALWEDYLNYQNLPANERYSGIIFIEENEIIDEGAYYPDSYIYNSSGNYRSIEYIVSNYSTGWNEVKEGTSTKNAISSLVDIAVVILSGGQQFYNTAINFFSNGITVLQSFLNFGNFGADYSLPTNSHDYFQVRLVFDKYTRYVHHKVSGNSWEVVLVMSKVKLKKIGQETYFASTGLGPNTTDRNVNIIYTSQHYNDYWDYATNFDGDSTFYESVKFSCCGYTWMVKG